MRKNNKFLMLLSLLFVVCLALPGCGGKTEKASTEVSLLPNGKVDPSKLEPVELIWQLPFISSQPDQDIVFEKVNKIVKEKLNATIKFSVTEIGNYQDKAKVILASGEPCDLMFASGWLNSYFDNAKSGAFADISELLPKYAPNLVKDIPKVIWDACLYNGKLYGVPNYQISTYTPVMYAVKEYADKYNYDTSSFKKLSDIEPLLKAVKENEKGVYPVNGAGGQLFNMGEGKDPVIAIGGTLAIRYSNPDVVENLYTMPEIMDQLRLLHNWYEKGYIRQDVLTIKNREPVSIKYAVSTDGNLAYKGANAAFRKANENMDIYELVRGKTIFGKEAVTAALTTIPEASKNKERALMFMDLLDADKELFNLLCYGDEGVHYKKLSENKIANIEKSRYKPGVNWVLGNTFKAFAVDPEPEDKNDRILQTHKDALISPNMSFEFNYKDYETEWVKMTGVINEILPSLQCGVSDPDEYIPKMMERLKNAGSDKVNDAVLKAWQEYRKNNK